MHPNDQIEERLLTAARSWTVHPNTDEIQLGPLVAAAVTRRGRARFGSAAAAGVAVVATVVAVLVILQPGRHPSSGGPSPGVTGATPSPVRTDYAGVPTDVAVLTSGPGLGFGKPPTQFQVGWTDDGRLAIVTWTSASCPIVIARLSVVGPNHLRAVPALGTNGGATCAFGTTPHTSVLLVPSVIDPAKPLGLDLYREQAVVPARAQTPTTDQIRAVATAAAHNELATLHSGPNDHTGWPTDVTGVSAVARRGMVTTSNTGHLCRSGIIVDVTLTGTFPTIAVGGIPQMSGGTTPTVHAVVATADADTGQICLVGVDTNAVRPAADAMLLFQR